MKDYAKVIQSIKKEYQNVNRENKYLKKELKKYEEKEKIQQWQNEMKKEQQQDLHLFFEKTTTKYIVDTKAAMIATILNILIIKEVKSEKENKNF